MEQVKLISVRHIIKINQMSALKQSSYRFFAFICRRLIKCLHDKNWLSDKTSLITVEAQRVL